MLLIDAESPHKGKVSSTALLLGSAGLLDEFPWRKLTVKFSRVRQENCSETVFLTSFPDDNEWPY